MPVLSLCMRYEEKKKGNDHIILSIKSSRRLEVE